MTVAGITSTGSKRPDALFGDGGSGPQRMVRARGCIVTAADGAEYVDFVMGLGAVALGYGHPAVDGAAMEAIARGSVGPIPPADEYLLANELCALMPWLEQVRFLKSGAEAVAAAVRLARTATGRDQTLGCGYHGWLDWCSDARGVPAATRSLHDTLRFNDSEHARTAIREAGDRLACVVVEPVIDAEPTVEWLQTLRAETEQAGALLIFDEIKTAFRIALGGATERWKVVPDLMVLGKAFANGFPLAAVGGRADIMRRVDETWISSTLATEFVSLAAARATINVMKTEGVPARLHLLGSRLFDGFRRLAATHERHGMRASGIPEMCYLRFADDALSGRVAAGCAAEGLLFKRSAYNFVSLAHDEGTIDRALAIIEHVVSRC